MPPMQRPQRRPCNRQNGASLVACGLCRVLARGAVRGFRTGAKKKKGSPSHVLGKSVRGASLRAHQAQLDALRQILQDDGPADSTVEQLARRVVAAKATLQTTLELTKQSHVSEVGRLQGSQSEAMAMFRRSVEERAQAESKVATELATVRAEHTVVLAKLASTTAEYDATRRQLEERLARAEAAHAATLECVALENSPRLARRHCCLTPHYPP